MKVFWKGQWRSPILYIEVVCTGCGHRESYDLEADTLVGREFACPGCNRPLDLTFRPEDPAIPFSSRRALRRTRHRGFRVTYRAQPRA
jgi:hypothetical protein